MTSSNESDSSDRWEFDNALWRDPAEVVSMWHNASRIDREKLRYSVSGEWWDTLEANDLTLLVSREYEHVVIALSVVNGHPTVSFLPIPHPSGMVMDFTRGLIHIASTRNPNQVYDLKPVTRLGERGKAHVPSLRGTPLMPIGSHYYPGSLYLHDLAIISGSLYANAVGENAVVRLAPDGSRKRAWWPKCIESADGPVFSRNHIQLNSIASGSGLRNSFFTASSDTISYRRPGHKNYPVDGRGVVFSGRTKKVFARGLTRPHSARLHQGQIWVNNSGYGELCLVTQKTVTPIARLPGWTRGLSLNGNTAFIGTSRVIPRFRHYAPGLDLNLSTCGVYAVDVTSGRVLGSITWSKGSQIYSVLGVPRSFTTGFPFDANGRTSTSYLEALFYAFETDNEKGG